MFLFGKKKLRRIQPEKSKSIKKIENRIKSTRWSTYLLVVFLFSLIITGTLGSPYLATLSRLTAAVIITTVSVFLMFFCLRALYPSLFLTPVKLFFFGLISIALLVLLGLFLKFRWPLYFLPVMLTSMIMAIGYSQQLAVLNLFFQIFLAWLLVEPADFSNIIIHLPCALVGIIGLTGLRARAKLIKLGALAGFLTLVMVISKKILLEITLVDFSQKIINEPFPNSLFQDLLASFANGFISGFIILGIQPFIEKLFGVLTDLSLLELTDMNQPLLKQLSLEAPGTYHHSLRVGNLAEAAAEAVGANSLLARVGSYFHDVGKLNKPEYFVENETDTASKHKDLAPTMSTLIITAHVKDGIEFARYHRLPAPIFDFIKCHHGTSVVKYFYHEACEKNNGSNENQVAPESFRYGGPKPQTKETGIVLLADSIEAASRTLPSVTPAKLKNLVHGIIISKLLDGQLDQSNLTMGELKKIEDTFTRVLAGIFHARIKYPDETAVSESQNNRSV
ncbi:MAG: HDIG domain-containing metalloprotein [Planctomycetota bacterium]